MPRPHHALATSVSWSHDFDRPAPEVWPWVSDTDRLNQMARVPSARYSHAPAEGGGSRRTGEHRIAGMRFGWEEHPFEWVKDQWFEVQRCYHSGPLKEARIRLELTPTASGCRMTQTFSYTARNWLCEVLCHLLLTASFRKEFQRSFARMARAMRTAPAAPFAVELQELPAPPRKEAAQLQERMREQGADEGVARKLIQYAYGAPDLDLVRIRPFALARQWKLPPRELLVQMLKATRAGLFQLSWDLVCPSCRGAKFRAADLKEVTSGAHCDACNLDFGVEFDRSVELTFTVVPSVRKVSSAEYCVGGPQKTRHYVAQLRVDPGEIRALELRLDPGVYRMRSLQDSASRFVTLAESAFDGLTPPLAEVRFAPVPPGSVPLPQAPLELMAGPVRVAAQNQHPREITFIVERTQWMEDCCTAGYAASLQDFRELFGAQVMRAGQEIAVRAVALLFTDLKGSTALYNQQGDARAFVTVRKHFDLMTEIIRRNEGALVKTIGDAVMASFLRPEDALRAALQIQKGIGELDVGPGGPLTLKIGLHHGPCFAVNLNDRLDYFGVTVNLAARAEGQCQGGDIVLSRRMLQDPAVREVARASGHPIREFQGALKGFDGAQDLCRIECGRPAAAASRSAKIA
jgi:class 3 adenylate cyclase